MKVIKFIIAVILYGTLGITTVVHAQHVFTDYKEADGIIMLDSVNATRIPSSHVGYTLLMPENNQIEGLVVIFDGTRRTLETIPEEMVLHPAAFKVGLGVLYISTGNPVDFYFDAKSMSIAADLINEATEVHNLKADYLFYAGMSLGGTRALRFNMYCKQNPEYSHLAPTAIAITDAPLDMTRFWKIMKRAQKLDFHPNAAGEGRWVSAYLRQELGGTPAQNPEAYQEYSPYTFTWDNISESSTNMYYLKEVPIRAYHEPDVNWWIENRQKGYYSMNSIDMAGLINSLQILGNKEAELLTTQGKREDLDESPHTWAIVDNDDLMGWFNSFITNR